LLRADFRPDIQNLVAQMDTGCENSNSVRPYCAGRFDPYRLVRVDPQDLLSQLEPYILKCVRPGWKPLLIKHSIGIGPYIAIRAICLCGKSYRQIRRLRLNGNDGEKY
jgi:hypothetical protein